MPGLPAPPIYLEVEDRDAVLGFLRAANTLWSHRTAVLHCCLLCHYHGDGRRKEEISCLDGKGLTCFQLLGYCTDTISGMHSLPAHHSFCSCLLSQFLGGGF